MRLPTQRPSRTARRVGAGILIAGLLAGCGGAATGIAVPADEGDTPAGVIAGAAVPTAGAAAIDTSTSDSLPTGGPKTESVPLSPLAALVRPLPSAAYDPSEHEVAIPPVRVSVEGVGVSDVPIRSVGLEPNGEMEIPPESEVGWYRNSPSPGDPGSSVLAGHIAFDGRPGAFRRLADTEVGALVEVTLLDGTTRSFQVAAVQQYAKDALPDELFRTDGPPMLTLITCGGTFQRSLGSYDSNIVVIAVPA